MKIFCLKNTNSYTIDAGSLVDVWKRPLVWHPAGGPHDTCFVEQDVLETPHVANLVAATQVVPDVLRHVSILGGDLGTLKAEYAAVFGEAGVIPASTPAAAPAGPTAEEIAAAEALAAEEAAAAKAAEEAAAKAAADAAAAKAAEEAAAAEASAKAEADAKAAAEEAEAAQAAADAEAAAKAEADAKAADLEAEAAAAAPKAAETPSEGPATKPGKKQR
jgi:hypothetical protein